MSDKSVPVNNNLQAVVPIGSYTFPFEIYLDNLKDYSNGFVNWHWQTELEFSYVQEGAVELQVLESVYTVSEGQGFFVTPGRLHMIKPVAGTEGIYFTVICHPCMIYGHNGSLIYQNYMEPIIKSPLYDILIFTEDNNWQNIIMQRLQHILMLYTRKSNAYELFIKDELINIWLQMVNNTFESGFMQARPLTSPEEQEKTTILINFIRNRYQEKITLADMASSIHVSRGECCRFFQRMIHMSPFTYLNDYRISRSISLLEENKMNISSISEEVGFSSINYFTSIFKKRMRCTPREYQKKLSHDSPVYTAS
jgi:AraC-like DNA-binding protein